MPGDSAVGGAGNIAIANAEGSISSFVPLNDILSGIAASRPISSVSISPDNEYVVF